MFILEWHCYWNYLLGKQHGDLRATLESVVRWSHVRILLIRPVLNSLRRRA